MRWFLAGLLVLLSTGASAEGPTTNKGAEEPPPYVRLVEREAYVEALPLVIEAAEAGESEGLFYFARYHAEGWAGLEQDYVSAQALYLKGSELGCVPCDYELGRLYDEGHGVDINKSLAMKHFRQAARRGHVEGEERYQKLYDAGTRLSVGRPVPDNLTAVPVYLLLSAPERLSDIPGEIQHRVFGGDDKTIALVAERVHLSPKDGAKASLEREQGLVTLSHDPESGHSSWRLPSFAPVDVNKQEEVWREVRMEFSLPSGKTFADYEIPISFQTNLSATNVVNLFVYKSGRISLQTATAADEYEHQFNSIDGLDPTAANLIELFTSSYGHWVLRLNGDVAAEGALDPRYFHRGLGNRGWFEDRIHIHSLAIRELLPRRMARGNPEYTMSEISDIEQKSASGYLDQYLMKLFPEREAEHGLRFAGTDMLYLRRDIEFMEMPDKSIVRRPFYIVESLVIAKPEEGDPVVFPVQKALAAGSDDDWAKGEVNNREISFRVHLNSIEESDVHVYAGRLSSVGKGWN